MKLIETITLMLGRVLISGYFLLNVTHQILNWQEMQTNFVTLLYNWNNYSSSSETMQTFLGTMVNWVVPLLIVAVFFEILGAVFVLLGTKSKLGGWLLILYLIPMTVFSYPFWYILEPAKDIAFIYFMQNLAILGGLFFIATFGSSRTKNISAFPDLGSRDE